MAQSREDCFYSTMYDLRHLIFGVPKYDAIEEQGGIELDLTPALILHVECFARHNRWRGRLTVGDDVLDEWVSRDRPVWNAGPPARIGLYRTVRFLLAAHFDVDRRDAVLTLLYPSATKRSAELQLASLLEGLVANWIECSREDSFSIPLDELALMQLAAGRDHPAPKEHVSFIFDLAAVARTALADGDADWLADALRATRARGRWMVEHAGLAAFVGRERDGQLYNTSRAEGWLYAALRRIEAGLPAVKRKRQSARRGSAEAADSRRAERERAETLSRPQ